MSTRQKGLFKNCCIPLALGSWCTHRYKDTRIIIRNRGGEMRFGWNFRQLSEVAAMDAYPLPRIDQKFLSSSTTVSYQSRSKLGTWAEATEKTSSSENDFRMQARLFASKSFAVRLVHCHSHNSWDATNNFFCDKRAEKM